MSEMPSTLRMRDITKSFSHVRVLDGVDFDLRAGEVHALLGGNGAGKSTLMKILEGVHQPEAGTIELDGEPVRLTSPQDARAHGIAMIFQDFSLVPSLSVAANIFLGAEPRTAGWIDDEAIERRATEQLRELRLDIDPRARVGTLGTAYWQLIEIAKALSREARILIMDEPTASLATSEVQRLFELIADLKARGLGIVYISHRLEEIERVADRVTILRDGRRVATEPAAALTMDQIIEHIAGEAVGEEIDADREPVSATEAGAPLLEVDGLSSAEGVRDVTITLHAGEILGVVGLMGSGRSELARALFGIDRITAGSVRLRGATLRLRTPADAVRAGIVLVPEDRRIQGLVLQHGVRSNLLLALVSRLSRWGLVDDKRGGEVYDSYADRLEIRAASPASPVRRLSGGNQQKVVIGKWLACEPDVLILDEPTAGVDVATRSEIVGMVRELADEGKGVILISSELTEILALCDRMLVLRDGRVSAELDRSDVRSEPDLHYRVQVG